MKKYVSTALNPLYNGVYVGRDVSVARRSHPAGMGHLQAEVLKVRPGHSHQRHFQVSLSLRIRVITGFVRVVIFTTISNKLHLTQLCKARVGRFSSKSHV